MNELHQPVMLSEVIKYLRVKENGIYVDCTLGTGGHSQSILARLKNGKLISFDWDKAVEEIIQSQEIFTSPQFQLISDNFANLERHLERLGIKEVDGFLFDLGLSSIQLSAEKRGFSYRLNSPLDMRMNQENKLLAEEIINNYPPEKLADIFYYYGEERKARLIARKICYWRQKAKITNIQQLVGIITSCFPKKSNKHPARKVFQALRIYINQELENFSQALEVAVRHLAPKGRVIVISYHSLEDRIAKQMFKKCNSLNDFQLVNKKLLVPSPEEISKNYRAHSAKMRVLERINQTSKLTEKLNTVLNDTIK